MDACVLLALLLCTMHVIAATDIYLVYILSRFFRGGLMCGYVADACCREPLETLRSLALPAQII